MKIAGLIILALGLLITLITGFNYVTKEKMVKIGEHELTADKTHTASWSLLIGITVIVVGGAAFFAGEGM